MLGSQGVTRVWADWLVYGVRYAISRERIESVFAFADAGASVGRKEVFSREAVVAALVRGATFCTVYATGIIEWRRGSKVSLIEIQGTKYLTIPGSRVRADDLGELPEM